MRHIADRRFWRAYESLPAAVRQQADEAYRLLKADPRHPSLRLKKVGNLWSVRIGLRHRALAVEAEGGLLWWWIGDHDAYDALVRRY